MSKTRELINEIKSNLNQRSSSHKDELMIMREMLNDSEYKVGIYNIDGKCGEYSPYESSREMVSNIIENTTKIPKQEAEQLANNYIFSKSDAECMVGISKEFINTYLNTDRKLSLGGRETSNISLLKKEVPERIINRPKKTGNVNADGSDQYEMIPVQTKGYTSVSVTGGCPKWI